jgi:simple sugar transport system permease protein
VKAVDILVSDLFWIGLLAAAVRLATPILLAALGELIAERAGILNIGLEGMMLFGALGGFLGSQITGSPWTGVLAGIAAGCILALLFAYLTVTLSADQIICGIMVNLLALGVTGFLHRAIFGITKVIPSATPLSDWHIPILSDVPILGPILFQQNPLVYLALALVLICWFLFARTTWGLKIRSVGEFPQGADSVGVSVAKVRYAAVLACGALAGLGGAFLSLGQLNMFVEHMTAGRGFIALAVVIFGRWNPLGVLAASLLFGGAEALQFRLQALGFEMPFQFLAILPYALTVIALVSIAGRAVQPAALGLPYRREA